MLDRVRRILTAKLFDGFSYIKDDRGQSHKIQYESKRVSEIYTPAEKRLSRITIAALLI